MQNQPVPSAAAQNHPDTLHEIWKWCKAIPRHFALPDWAWCLAFCAGMVVALLVSPRGRIATFIDLHPIGEWLPKWLPWWWVVMAAAALALVLLSLFFRRRSENRMTAIQERLARTKNLLFVVGVQLIRETDTRWSIVCAVRSFVPFRDAGLPSVLYLRTAVDKQHHTLTYNPETDQYEGGTDTNALAAAVKNDMQSQQLGNAPCFLRVAVMTHDENWRVVGETDDAVYAWLIATHNVVVPPENQCEQNE